MGNNVNIEANKIILLLGAVFGALIASVASGTLGGIVLGIVIGLAFAGFFINVLLPNKPSDR